MKFVIENARDNCNVIALRIHKMYGFVNVFFLANCCVQHNKSKTDKVGKSDYRANTAVGNKSENKGEKLVKKSTQTLCYQLKNDTRTAYLTIEHQCKYNVKKNVQQNSDKKLDRLLKFFAENVRF